MKNFLMSMTRNMVSNPFYAFINIAGLTIGFTSAILIGAYLQNQFSYDKWIPNYRDISRVDETYSMPGQPDIHLDVAMPRVASRLQASFGKDIIITRLHGDSAALRYGDMEANEAIYWADPNFFDVFSLPVVAGDLKAALTRPDSIVITRAVARKYFSTDNPIGKILFVTPTPVARADARSGPHPMRVTAVLQDLPSDTHLDLRILAAGKSSYSPMAQSGYELSDTDHANTYLRLTSKRPFEEFQRVVSSFGQEHVLDALRISTGTHLTLSLAPLSTLHLRPAGLGAMKPSADMATLSALAIAGFLVVAVAAINFINLMTAQSSRRGKEVGLRKACGARRFDLILQFLGESSAYVFIAALLAASLVEMFLPAFISFMDAETTFYHWQSYLWLLAIPLSILVTGLAAGAYPAFILSSFRPAMVLKSSSMADTQAGTGMVRSALVTLQFCVLAVALIATLTISQQTHFALRDAVRNNFDQVVLVFNCKEAFRDEVRAIPGVRGAACSGRTGISTLFWSVTVRGTKNGTVQSRQTQVDFGFFELYGLKPLAGRLFSRNYKSDMVAPGGKSSNSSVIINQAALSRFGFSTPASAIGKPIFRGRAVPLASTIVGVVPDFSLNTIREPVEPQVYYIDPTYFDVLHVKVDGARIPEVMAAIGGLWKNFGEQVPLSSKFLDDFQRSKYADIIRQGQAFGFITAIALVIACLGLFTMAAFMAGRRTKEIGVRKAMGADTGHITGLLLWQFVRPVLWANLIAWPLAFFAMQKWLAGFAYHIVLSPWIFAGATALAIAIALSTVAVHAVVTARTAPVTALRYE